VNLGNIMVITMTNIITVGFETEQQIVDWIGGYDSAISIKFNGAIEKQLGVEVINEASNRLVSLMEYMGRESYVKCKCAYYINVINERLTEMVK